MPWHDRVIRPTDGEEDSCAIDAVSDNDNGRPEAPAHPAGETFEAPADDLQASQAARQPPVLDEVVCLRARGERFGAEEP